MAVNPDPKPGRWILPLVVLGMIAFTYFFVRELPEASTDTTLAPGGGGVAATSTTTGENGDSSTSTPGTQPTLDPATQAYLDEIDAINQELQVQRTELVSVNEAFNQDPREVEYPEAEERFEAVETTTQDLATRQSGLTPPEAVSADHESLVSDIDLASESITQALEGLRSTDEGQQRNSAVDAYIQAAEDYDTGVTNTHNTAGSSGGNGDGDSGNAGDEGAGDEGAGT